MAKHKKELSASLKAIFKEEGYEIIAQLDNALSSLEKNNDHQEIHGAIMEMTRIIHSLKASTAILGYNNMVDFLHKLEDGLIFLKDKKGQLGEGIITNLFQATESFRNDVMWLIEKETDIPPKSEGIELQALTSINSMVSPVEDKEVDAKQKKIIQNDLNKALQDQEEARRQTTTTVRVNIEKLDQLVNLVGELVISESRLKVLAGTLGEGKKRSELLSKCAETSRIVSDLQEEIMDIRMVPLDIIFSQFYRMVRNLSKTQKKVVRLVLTGQETELDKNIVEKINTPLKHLVRNCIDHGIELPEERERVNKSAEATINIEAYQRDGAVFIEINDDGRGLDKEAILEEAIRLGLIKREEECDDQYIYQMIFNSGFSTAKTVSNISGRGVGMDVVRQQVADLNGQIEIRTSKGIGTSFVIRLPLTLAIIDGLLFNIGNEKFVIPLLTVDEVLRPLENQISTIEGKGEYIKVQGKPVSLIRTNNLLKIKNGQTDPLKSMVLNVNVNHKKYSLMVDSIIGQQQVVIKNLDENYTKVQGFSGVTILGDGHLATIIDPLEIVSIFRESNQGESKV